MLASVTYELARTSAEPMYEMTCGSTSSDEGFSTSDAPSAMVSFLDGTVSPAGLVKEREKIVIESPESEYSPGRLGEPETSE